MTTTADIAQPAADVTAVVRSRWQPLRSRKILIGTVIMGIFVVMAVVGPWVAPHDPSAITSAALQPPSAAHPLGTTQTGQDVLSQVLVGARSALVVSCVAGAIATVLAILVGVTSGFVGGVGEESLSALANIFLVLPGLPLVIVLAAYVPGRGDFVVALVVSVTGWAHGARVLRAQTLSIRQRDFVEAARATGERAWRIIVFEIVPNEMPIIASAFLGSITGALLTAAGLAFLGLGNVTSWSWGTILYWAQNGDAFEIGAWWWYVPAGLCVALMGCALALINFGIDELINPRLRSAGLSARRGRARPHRGFTPVLRDPVLRDTAGRRPRHEGART